MHFAYFTNMLDITYLYRKWINISAYVFVYFVCQFSGSIGVTEADNLRVVGDTCETSSSELVAYDPISFYDILQSVDNTKALKKRLKFGQIVRMSSFGYLSPTFYYVECLDEIKYQQSKHEFDLNANRFNRQPVGYLYSCGIDCLNKRLFSNATTYFGISNNTCYCVGEHELSALVDDKYCSDDYTDKFNTSNYISVYTTFSPIGNVIEYSPNYLRLCRYAARTSVGGVDLVYGLCNLPVDGVVCDVNGNYTSLECSDVSTVGQSGQCVIHETPSNISFAKKFCRQYSGNLANDPDLNYIRSVFRANKQDKLYLLNGHRELLHFNTHKNGTTCISLMLQAGELFLLSENCIISRRYLCVRDETGLIIFIVFMTISSFLLLVSFIWRFQRRIRTQFRICKSRRPKDISLEDIDRNVHRPISLQDQQNNEDSVPGRITAGSVSGRLNYTGSVPGRMADGSVSGCVNGGTVPGRRGNGYVMAYSSDDSDC